MHCCHSLFLQFFAWTNTIFIPLYRTGQVVPSASDKDCSFEHTGEWYFLWKIRNVYDTWSVWRKYFMDLPSLFNWMVITVCYLIWHDSMLYSDAQRHITFIPSLSLSCPHLSSAGTAVFPRARWPPWHKRGRALEDEWESSYGKGEGVDAEICELENTESS